MIALYDYRPDKDSPNLHSDIELEFNAGDHITVYGTMVKEYKSLLDRVMILPTYCSTVMDFIVEN